jgi:hypothetical protein
MKPGPVQPWGRSAVNARADDERAAMALFRGLPPPPALSPTAWARIMGAVRRDPPMPRWSLRLPHFGFKLVVAALLAMALPLSAALGWRGVREAVRHLSAQGLHWAHRGMVAPPATHRAREDRPAPTTALPAPAPQAPPPVIVAPPAETGPAVVRAPQAPAERETAESARLFRESQMVGSALQALQSHRPAEAIDMLSAYRRKFPRGSMAGEATFIEVQADLELGREGQALEKLELLARDDFSEVPRPNEARLVRAELLAREGECGRAIPSFDRLLSEALSAPLEQRALYGRGACRATVGDVAGSRSDLLAYLARFPEGRFAAEARRAIGRTR